MRLRVAASVLLFAAIAASVCAAQSRGVPASVTSLGFGGNRSATPGVPASVTSSGSLGFRCCINPLFPRNPNPPMGNLRFRHHHSGAFPVYVPLYTSSYDQPVIVAPEDRADQDDGEDDEYGAGPTVFDHRGPRRHAAEEAYDRGYERGRAAEEEARVAREERAARKASEPAQETRDTATKTVEQAHTAIEPKTVLVFRDGHKEEVTNYAIVGDELFDFTAGRRKIAIAALDVTATAKANDERGLDFQLPVARSGN